ncbi:hypothetical protein CABS03_13595 [Colletotrichum abscissum]
MTGLRWRSPNAPTWVDKVQATIEAVTFMRHPQAEDVIATHCFRMGNLNVWFEHCRIKMSCHTEQCKETPEELQTSLWTAQIQVKLLAECGSIWGFQPRAKPGSEPTANFLHH